MSNLSSKINLPLAVGERNAGIWEFKEYAELVNPGFFKPDIAVAGGITGVKKISDIAQAHHIKICPHNFQSPIATAACISVAVSSHAWDVQESVDEDLSPRRDITDQVIKLKDGWYYPSEKPGLGVNFNEESVKKHHKKGRKTLRERIDFILDKKSFNEVFNYLDLGDVVIFHKDLIHKSNSNFSVPSYGIQQ